MRIRFGYVLILIGLLELGGSVSLFGKEQDKLETSKGSGLLDNMDDRHLESLLQSTNKILDRLLRAHCEQLQKGKRLHIDQYHKTVKELFSKLSESIGGDKDVGGMIKDELYVLEIHKKIVDENMLSTLNSAQLIFESNLKSLKRNIDSKSRIQFEKLLQSLKRQKVLEEKEILKYSKDFNQIWKNISRQFKWEAQLLKSILAKVTEKISTLQDATYVKALQSTAEKIEENLKNKLREARKEYGKIYRHDNPDSEVMQLMVEKAKDVKYKFRFQFWSFLSYVADHGFSAIKKDLIAIANSYMEKRNSIIAEEVKCELLTDFINKAHEYEAWLKEVEEIRNTVIKNFEKRIKDSKSKINQKRWSLSKIIPDSEERTNYINFLENYNKQRRSFENWFSNEFHQLWPKNWLDDVKDKKEVLEYLARKGLSTSLDNEKLAYMASVNTLKKILESTKEDEITSEINSMQAFIIGIPGKVKKINSLLNEGEALLTKGRTAIKCKKYHIIWNRKIKWFSIVRSLLSLAGVTKEIELTLKVAKGVMGIALYFHDKRIYKKLAKAKTDEEFNRIWDEQVLKNTKLQKIMQIDPESLKQLEESGSKEYYKKVISEVLKPEIDNIIGSIKRSSLGEEDKEQLLDFYETLKNKYIPGLAEVSAESVENSVKKAEEEIAKK